MRKRRRQDISQTDEKFTDKPNLNNRTRLPPRWLYCPPMGKIIAKRFLPMKAPLDESYDHLIDEPKYRFHPQVVFQIPLLDAKSDAKIGLWIDLTNSDCFYRGDIVRKHDCKYVKMKMVGHGQSPTPEQTTNFVYLVDNFLKQNQNDLIVVHCTHGFNRTGFLISAYLYEKNGLSIEMAVKEFAESRPNGIYKQLYLDDLQNRFGDEDDEQLMAPDRPLWENGPISDEEFTNQGAFCFGVNGKIKNERRIDAIQTTPSSEKGTMHVPQFMDGKVHTVIYVRDIELRKNLQEKARKFCGYGLKGFPGSQPVSLEGLQGNKNISYLAKEPYMVSWKADGIRYLVLIDGKNRVFAFDRDNNPFNIQKITFLRRTNEIIHHAEKSRDDDEFINETLVDAEMVIDKVETAGQVQEIPRLLIYDLITLHGDNLRDQPFNQRFELIETELIRPRTEAFKYGRLNRKNEPIGVRRKDFWNIEYTYKLFQPGFLSCHEVDGLIFQPVKRPYTAGRFEYLMKWKPPELSTIDFRLEIKKNQRPGMLAEYVGELHLLHLDLPFAYIKATKLLQKYHEKIIECKYMKETKTWEFLRERTDKSHPNAFSTAQSVWNTIQFPVNKNDLLYFIKNHAFGMDKKHI